MQAGKLRGPRQILRQQIQRRRSNDLDGAAAGHGCLHPLGVEIILADNQTRAAVRQIVLQIGAGIHRIERHHDGLPHPDGHKGHHRLRYILHHHDHPVSCSQAHLRQRGGQTQRHPVNIAVAESAFKIVQARIIRIGRSRLQEFVQQADRRHRQRGRQPIGIGRQPWLLVVVGSHCESLGSFFVLGESPPGLWRA